MSNSSTGPVASTSSSTTNNGDEGLHQFTTDERVHFDRTSQKWVFEAEDGSEMEWDQQRNAWVPVLEDDLIAVQQAAYKVDGVDESAPAAPIVAQKKRKLEHDNTNESNNHNNNSTKPKKAARPPKPNTAVFVSHLPPTTTIPTLYSVFSKAGLILEDGEGEPRIKLYYDPDGRFKGEALIIYLQEQSVGLAIQLLDETELELGKSDGRLMRVTEAEAWRKKTGTATTESTDPVASTSASASASTSTAPPAPPKKRTEQEKKKLTRQAEKLKQKLTDWSSDEEDSTKAIVARARSNKIVVLEGMFTLQELDDDPALLLDLKEDVRNECETMGNVTNVTLYDKEDSGIITIRFKDEISAQACIAKMNGRFFGGRSIAAYPLDPTKKYRRTGQGVTLEGTGLDLEADKEEELKEKERLERYQQWLEKGGDEGGK